MAQFVCKYLKPNGKEEKKHIDARSRDEAMRILKGQGCTVISCEEAVGLKQSIGLGSAKRVSPRDFAVFCHQFASINKAGVPVVDCFEMLGNQTENPSLQNAIRNVHTDISKGDSLATAMKKNSGVFPEMLNNMVEAGEASGSIDKSFERMAIQFEKDAALTQAVKKAITYPIILVVVMIGVIIAMMVFVVPTFMEMFADLDTEMPASTMVLVHLSDFFVSWWWLVGLIVFLIFALIKWYSSTDAGKEVTSSLALKLPLLGPVKTKSACARLGRTLCTLLAAGVSMTDALEITGKSMENLLYKRAMKEAKEQVMRGLPLSKPLKSCGLFPPMIIHMVSIGEETGNIETMLENVANYYEEDVQLATEQLMTMLEPAIICVMAVVVGYMCVAIFSPMFALYDSLT